MIQGFDDEYIFELVASITGSRPRSMKVVSKNIRLIQSDLSQTVLDKRLRILLSADSSGSSSALQIKWDDVILNISSNEALCLIPFDSVSFVQSTTPVYVNCIMTYLEFYY